MTFLFDRLVEGDVSTDSHLRCPSSSCVVITPRHIFLNHFFCGRKPSTNGKIQEQFSCTTSTQSQPLHL